MGELIEEYGKIILFIILCMIIFSAILFSLEIIGAYMLYFTDKIV